MPCVSVPACEIVTARLWLWQYELAHEEGDSDAGRVRAVRRSTPEEGDSIDALVGQLSSFQHAAKAHGF